MPSAIRSFTDLRVWQEGHKLVLEVYRITKNFPKEEIFGLVSQIRRAVVSITSNIAEGFARNSEKEKFQFYAIAKGSLVEVQNQLLIARDVKYTSQEEFQKLAEQTVVVHKMLNAFISALRKSASPNTKY
ncbi:MAG: four helix bundle protein [bacterium]|nr:four helix bundle protein [bacterium]